MISIEYDFSFELSEGKTFVWILKHGTRLLGLPLDHENEEMKLIERQWFENRDQFLEYEEESGDKLTLTDWQNIEDVLISFSLLNRTLTKSPGHSDGWHDRREAADCEYCQYVNLFVKRWEEFQQQNSHLR